MAFTKTVRLPSPLPTRPRLAHGLAFTALFLLQIVALLIAAAPFAITLWLVRATL